MNYVFIVSLLSLVSPNKSKENIYLRYPQETIK
jgi:hypothetical protein